MMKKPVIKPIEVDKEKLEQLKAILSSKTEGPFHKRDFQKKLVGECCICGKIPTKKVIKDVGDAKLIEKYCEACYA
jgi:hypothetical protein